MNTCPSIATTFLLLVIATGSVVGDDDFLQNDVFVSGTEGYHTFRIPAVIATDKGTILAFCEGRRFSREDLGNNDVLLKRSTDGGRTWGKLRLVYEEGGDKNVTIANPTVVIDEEDSVIWMVMQRNGADVLVSHSKDDGLTWAKATDITKDVKKPQWGFYAVGPGIGIQIKHGPHKGRLVIPAYHRETKDKSGPSTAHMFFSDDHGKTWQLGSDSDLHTNECQTVETMVDGQSELLLNARNHWARSGGRPDLAGVRMIARSRDGGVTWSKTSFDKTLVEPQCQASILRYSWPSEKSKSRILFANPASRSRNNVTVRLSLDEGKTWPVSRTIYKPSSAYTCLTKLNDGRIGILYERDDYKHITFASFTLDWLTGDARSQSINVVKTDEGLLFREGKTDVLFYQRKTKSRDGKYPRAHYIHPLYDLDGNVLTEDFPKDHLHHRGIFWAWHQLWVGDNMIGDGWACKDFQWDVQSAETHVTDSGSAILETRVLWKSSQWNGPDGEPKPLVDEKTAIQIHPRTDRHRMIDFEIRLRALEENIRLGGSDNDKGYGGFSVRVRLPDDIRFIGRTGELAPQRTAIDGGPWLDMLASFAGDSKSGLTILCHPSSAGFPQRWILRRRGSMQNPVYPGQEPVALSKTDPLVLRYRLVLHQAEVSAAEIEKWQIEFARSAH